MALTSQETSPTPAPPVAASPAPERRERAPIIPTRVFRVVFVLSVLIFVVAFAFDDPDLSPLFRGLGFLARLITGVLAIVSLVVLVGRARVPHALGRAARGVTVGTFETVRRQRDTHEGAGERMADWSRERANKFGRFVLWLINIPLRILFWLYYRTELLLLWLVLVLYDIIYYATYLAYRLVGGTLRLAGRIVWFALKIVWKVLKPVTYVPGIRGWWRDTKRPEILSAWHNFHKQRHHRRQVYVDQQRRLATVRGENPDRWEADWKRRDGFRLPRPDKARVHIRRRLAHVRAVQRARRQGKPIPKWPRAHKEPKPESPPPDDFSLTQAPAAKDPTAEAPEPAPASGRRRRLAGVLRGKKPPAEPEPPNADA